MAPMRVSMSVARSCARFGLADAFAHLTDGGGDVGKARVRVGEPLDPGAFELGHQVLLRVIQEDQIRTQRQNPLDIGIEQRADALALIDLGRIPVEVADRNDAASRADREQHFRHRRHDRDDPGRLGGCLSGDGRV